MKIEKKLAEPPFFSSLVRMLARAARASTRAMSTAGVDTLVTGVDKIICLGKK